MSFPSCRIDSDTSSHLNNAIAAPSVLAELPDAPHVRQDVDTSLPAIRVMDVQGRELICVDSLTAPHVTHLAVERFLHSPAASQSRPPRSSYPEREHRNRIVELDITTENVQEWMASTLQQRTITLSVHIGIEQGESRHTLSWGHVAQGDAHNSMSRWISVRLIVQEGMLSSYTAFHIHPMRITVTIHAGHGQSVNSIVIQVETDSANVDRTNPIFHPHAQHRVGSISSDHFHDADHIFVYSENDDLDMEQSDSDLDDEETLSCFSMEAEESCSEDPSDEYVCIRRGDTSEFPIIVESDTDDDENENEGY
ncbi:hypothetical protein ONZ51_g12282 [Trametes cubensis]|uniref:Uncharacterized protein n=1 Tax=Trametes cubensis TaxID=1111947 RepID=A0AAD7TGG7_9APHY|nr:hypothetical protein ONZ51_g12282 [Trametes cubensis]